jgi:endonuclease-3
MNFIIETLSKIPTQIPLHHTSPYTLLIAVLLSAQCTDARVNLVTPHLFKKAKTPEEMIQLPVSEISQIIHSCGFFKKKAQAIWDLSKILCDEYQGKVPASEEELIKLPGVGRKTASVVLAQAFQIPAFPVDTHIHRCAKRWGLSNGKTVEQTERDLKKIFPKSLWIDLHLQMILYARAHCPARGHKLENCPICQWIKKRDF